MKQEFFLKPSIKPLSAGLFIDLDKLIVKFIGKKNEEIAKKHFSKKNESVALPDNKTCNERIASTTVWH